MMQAPVSVIIPSYNSASMVTHAIESALAQTLPPAQIIVVDDGSTDDTPDRLEPYRDSILYLRQQNQGVCVARNHAIRNSNQPYVAFLDADDVWHPRKLEIQMRVFTEHPDLVMLGTSVFFWPTAAFPQIRGDVEAELHPVSHAQLLAKNRMATSSVVIRREALDRVGLFDPDLLGVEDRDLWVRVAGVGASANIDLQLAGYRQVPNSLSKRAAVCEAAAWRFLRKLDRGRVWRGRFLLRLKSRSYIDHTYAYVWDAAGCHARALLNSLRSLLRYPLPYRRCEVETRFERLKRFAVLLLRACRLKSDDPSPFRANETADLFVAVRDAEASHV